jgi:type I restriction enzyme M protein
MWMLHFLHHLKDGGTAGFVMATGELSNGETARFAVRKALLEADYVDCIVQLSGQLFANTQIPCCLWFLSKNRDGSGGFRKRRGDVLFIDGRKMGALIPGSRKQKSLSADEVQRIASVYHEFRREGSPETIPGFCAVASRNAIAEHRYALTPGRYVGNAEALDEDEPFDVRFPALLERLNQDFEAATRLQAEVRTALSEVSDAF